MNQHCNVPSHPVILDHYCMPSMITLTTNQPPFHHAQVEADHHIAAAFLQLSNNLDLQSHVLQAVDLITTNNNNGSSCPSPSLEVVVVSNDKDFLQLVPAKTPLAQQQSSDPDCARERDQPAHKLFASGRVRHRYL